MPNKSKNLTQIIKRDGRTVKFDRKKIVTAMLKATAQIGEFDPKEADRLSKIAVTILNKSNGKHIPTVEQVQDIVEQVLMAGGYYDTAKAYILYREKHREEREAKEFLGVEDDLGLKLNQLKVIERRYLLHDEDGKVTETPREWLKRVAKALAKVETKDRKLWADRFFEVMANFEFLPAGRTLNNAGTKQNQLANCFVLPVEDSMEGIFDAIKWTALVHQSGGGTGFNFSKLRPSGDIVTKSPGGYATGPVSFMKVFDVATRQVMQGGKKRGANMGILNIDHPDIIDFITCKTEEGEIANFNISVGITDEFMEAVRDDRDFSLKNPRTGEPVQTLKARLLMDQIAALAWRTGDPGMINLSAINRTNPLLKTQGPINATNPCGEQPLHPFDACNLGSINLAKFALKLNKPDKPLDQRIDWNRLSQVTRLAVRMLDNVIDACSYPLPQIEKTVKQNRRIGLGVMGWADLLFQLGIPYNSDQAVTFAGKVMAFVQKESWLASKSLARQKGPFPRWQESAFAKGFNPLTNQTEAKTKWKVRNVAITTIAPTGTISMAADTSSGIEPAFALSFVKQVVDDAGLTYLNPHFEAALTASLKDDDQVQDAIVAVIKKESAQGVTQIPKNLQQVFVTAHDISWEWHVKMQAAFQAHTDNAVSKTINFPKEAGIEDIKAAYLLAWELGCKGITVYRDQSKSFQVLGHASDSQPAKKTSNGHHQPYLIQSKLKVKTLKQRASEGLVKADPFDTCPECGGPVTKQEGCNLCHTCGWSVCSA